jgi:ABC-type branched-subunit amino acid transport system ATPase component/ABC-type branched-subunit amino acid transport system permease subunit
MRALTRAPLQTALWAVLGALALVWVMGEPGYWIFTANSGLVLAVSTLGLMVVVGWIKEVSLVQAGLTGTAVYLCAYFNRPSLGWGLPYLVAAALAIGVVSLVSFLIALASERLSGIYIMVLTLALQVTIERTVFSDGILTSPGKNTTPRPSLLGVTLSGDRGYFFFTLAVLGGLILFLARLRRSRFGRGLLLVGTDRQAAAAVGVSPWRAKVFAFVLAGFCAGLAGALTAPLYSTPPVYIAYTTFQSLFYLSIPVLAGFSSLGGVAGVALGFLLVPQALEHHHISPFALGSAGLIIGTCLGARGLSGLIADRLRSRRWALTGTDRLHDVRGWVDLATGARPRGREAEQEQAVAVLEAWLPSRPPCGDLLVARDISVAFGGLRALNEVTITVPAGGFVGLIGPNGAGKTTLFDVINGLRTPDSGTITFAGADITNRRPWERADLGLSRTFQATRVNLDLSVAENLLAGAYTMVPGGLAASILGGRAARQGQRRAEEAARAVAVLLDVDRYWDEPVSVLSFGNRRRVEIGRSLMSGPRLLLLDEPSAGLDPAAAALLFSLTRQLHRDLGLTVLLVEHYVRAVLEHCDLIHVLSRGEVVATGTPGEVANHPDVRSEYLGPDFEIVLPEPKEAEV